MVGGMDSTGQYGAVKGCARCSFRISVRKDLPSWVQGQHGQMAAAKIPCCMSVHLHDWSSLCSPAAD